MNDSVSEGMETMRLQRYLSSCGILSRRAAEQAILDGLVLVNGQKAQLGDKVTPGQDIVTYKGQLVQGSLNDDRIYLMLNKPSGYVTTLSDEKGRKTASDLLTSVQRRVYPVGRLDMYSDGLLLFTDDGDLTNRLTHPSFHITKQYRLFVKGLLTQEEVKKLTLPMVIDGYQLKPVQAEMENNQLTLGGAPCTSILITLSEGRNRQIRKMCEKVGFVVIKLTRIKLGDIKLGDLPVGQYRLLTKQEIEYLKTATKKRAD